MQTRNSTTVLTVTKLRPRMQWRPSRHKVQQEEGAERVSREAAVERSGPATS